MKILLDESAPRLIQDRLSHLEIRTVQEMGWGGLKNGDLLRRAAGQFDIFVTADKNIRHQQNLSQYKIAIVVLPGNEVPMIVRIMPVLERTLKTIEACAFVEIAPPTTPGTRGSS